MRDVDNKIKMIIEGILLAAGKPVSLDEMIGVFSEEERPDKAELRQVLDAIREDCNDRGFELREVASGFRFQVKQEISEWIARLWEEKPPRYSRALLETLALIAYRQPITRGDIEEIRGVAVSSSIIRTLMDREWVRIVGHKDVPGRPALFATTRQFLDYFNMRSIQELPPLSEVREMISGGDEFDVEDDLANRRVLELPAEEVLPEAGADILDWEPEDLPAEDEAIALSKKPLDEILGLGSVPEDDDEFSPEDPSFVPDDDFGERAGGNDAEEKAPSEAQGQVPDNAAGERDATDAAAEQGEAPVAHGPSAQ